MIFLVYSRVFSRVILQFFRGLWAFRPKKIPYFLLLITSCQAIPTPTPHPTATAEAFNFGIIDSDICGQLSETPLPSDPDCRTSRSTNTIPTNACTPAQLAQAICMGESDSNSLCIEGYEINCQRTTFDVNGLHPAPQSICSGLTVNDIGYGTTNSAPYHIDAGCLQTMPANRQVVNCEFMGQTLVVNADFCQRLTSCVAPQINEAFAIVDTVRQVPVYRFPSGGQRLHIDLSCSEHTAPYSLHHPRNGCRAIDINVEQNYGNLRIESPVPLSTMPPAFVAIMESCGIVWGGRYNGADGVEQGCDPMEFAYAPRCFE